MTRRVVITGLGAVSAVGIGVEAFWGALRHGTPGIDTITRFDASTSACKVAAEIRDFDPAVLLTNKVGLSMGRVAQMAAAVGRMAFDDAGLASVGRVSRFPVCFGSGAGATPELQDAFASFMAKGIRRRSALNIVNSLSHSVTNLVSVELGLSGQTMTLGSACASGVDAIQWACEQILAGRAPGAVAGAADAPLIDSIHAAWGALGWLSRWPGPPAQALRPFDVLSDGSVLGEGAGGVVLEDLDHARARGARIHAEVLGYGSASDGLDMRTIDPTGASLQEAMRAALRMARLGPGDIDYINTHGGGVPKHDRAETAAHRAVFGRHAYNFPVSSIKPMIGQPFAAAGALQVLAACFALAHQFVPPTLNLDVPDPECDLDYVPDRGRVARVSHALVATRALGPTHSALVLGLPPDR